MKTIALSNGTHTLTITFDEKDITPEYNWTKVINLLVKNFKELYE